MPQIILASASPRRKELLEQIGIQFEIEPAAGEERISESAPEQAVMELARQKAEKIAQTAAPDAVVIGADTVVAYAQEILGKPADQADACRMLTMLQGHTHAVYTGVCVIAKAKKAQPLTFYERTDVTMYAMSRQEIRAYVASGEPMDKAGAYGIQGLCAAFIKEIHGDYNNVVGLPVARLYQECRRAGIDLY